MPTNQQPPSTKAVERTNAQNCAFVIDAQLGIQAVQRTSGPPQRLPGMTLGIIDMTHNAPHGGEIHPDGDELLYVISGRIRVTAEIEPELTHEFGPGDSCLVRKNHWHQVDIVEPTQLLHVTPGPNGDHRPLTAAD